jgi:hypothetical protein
MTDAGVGTGIGASVRAAVRTRVGSGVRTSVRTCIGAGVGTRVPTAVFRIDALRRTAIRSFDRLEDELGELGLAPGDYKHCDQGDEQAHRVGS